MPEYVTPGVYYELVDTAPPAVRGLRTDIAAFVGIAPRGPLQRPVRIESWRRYQAIFGSFVSYGFLAYAVKGFIENGGENRHARRGRRPPAPTRAVFLATVDPPPTKRGRGGLGRPGGVGIVCFPDMHITPAPPAPVPELPPPPPADPCLPCAANGQNGAPPAPADGVELPPRFSVNDVRTMHRALIEHCELHRD